jgi:hypothetical protein
MLKTKDKEKELLKNLIEEKKRFSQAILDTITIQNKG